MDRRDLPRAVGVVILAVLVVCGPLTGIDATSERTSEFGEGTATVNSVSVPAGELRVTPGRFGTQVAYLRVPPATVDIASVSERPRLVYLVEVPSLDVSLVTTAVVTESKSYRLEPSDRGLSRNRLRSGPYRARLRIRVQSFEMDRVVYDRNVTVEVGG